MKILIIARGIPNKHDPQEGCFEWDQAKALAAKGNDVTVMAIDGRVRKFWRTPGIQKINKDNITAYKLFYFPTAIIRRLISLKSGYNIEAFFAKRLYRHITKEQGDFDIIHSHYLTCSYQGVKIKQRFGCKLVATEHWSALKATELPFEIKFLGENTYKYLDRLISVSDHLGKSIKEHFNVDYSVVHNLIDTSLLQPALDKTNNSAFTIVAVGSLLKVKGFDILIKAFAKSKARHSNAILKIIGSGNEYNNLKQTIESLELKNKVFLCGQKPKPEVYNELRNADLFILSSRSENFSVALIEATANGSPAIGTLCGGVQEYPVSNVTKVPVEDIDALASAIDKSIDNQNTVDRRQLQLETLSLFSPEAIASQLEKIYIDTINQPNNTIS